MEIRGSVSLCHLLGISRYTMIQLQYHWLSSLLPFLASPLGLCSTRGPCTCLSILFWLSPKYFCDLIRLLTSATSLRPLHSIDLNSVPCARIAMAKSRAFAFIGPSLWSQLSTMTPTLLQVWSLSASFCCLKTAL